MLVLVLVALPLDHVVVIVDLPPFLLFCLSWSIAPRGFQLRLEGSLLFIDSVPPQLSVLSRLQEWFACKPTLCCVMLSSIFFFSHGLLPCLSEMPCKKSFVIYILLVLFID